MGFNARPHGCADVRVRIPEFAGGGPMNAGGNCMPCCFRRPVFRPRSSVLCSPYSVLRPLFSVFRPPSSVSARHLPAERERERWCPVWGPVTDWPYLGSRVLEDPVEVIQHGAGAVGPG